MQNYHIIKVKYLGATNTKGSRVKLTSDRFEESKTIPYDYTHNNVADMALDYLREQGHEIIGQGETKDGAALISNTFESIK